MHKYTPILQIKEGELKALEDLLSYDKSKIIPLIQLLPDLNENRKGDYVTDRTKPLLSGWSFLDNRIYIDPAFLSDGNIHLTMAFFEKLKQGNINIIPVVRPNSTESTKSLFRSYLLHGICLRINGSEVSAEIINKAINSYKSFYSLETNEIDLLIDFGVITVDNEIHFYNSFEHIFDRIDQIKSVRKVIVASGSFPSDLGQMKKDTITSIPRTEWSLWKRIKKFVGDSVELTYADYGNVHPVYNEENSKRRGTCSIKYSDTDNFYIFKGEQAKNSPISTGQYQIKAKELVSKSYYSGNSFSWGDQYISDCAEGRESPGGSTTWVKITQNHHFVKMLHLLR